MAKEKEKSQDQAKRSDIAGGHGNLQKHHVEMAILGKEAGHHGVDENDAAKWLADLVRDAPPLNEIEVVVVIRRRCAADDPPPVAAYSQIDTRRADYISRTDYAALYGSDEADGKKVF